MSQVQHMGSLPAPEDVMNLLEAAHQAAEGRYQGAGYSYVRDALCKLFSDSIEWLNTDVDPYEVLVEALQDERAILDRHNRLQAKALFRQEETHGLSEELVNFPLRFMSLKDDDVKPPADSLEPIYQVADHHKVKEAAQKARLNTTTTVSQSNGPPANDPSKPSTNNPGYSLGTLSDAPSPGHDFPDGNITLAEMAAFLPQSFKCWDVIDRILWNGAAAEDLAILINKYRAMPSGKIKINTVYMMMRGQMRKRGSAEHGYKNWKSWVVGAQEDVEKREDFDPDSVSVTGFRRPIIFKNRPDKPAKPVPFKDLANGVVIWPEHGDALDLTRCVSWCVNNPEEVYYYPTDYQKVLYECLDGPVIPKARHSDAEVLSRLRSDRSVIGLRRRTNTNRNNADTESSGEDSDGQLGKRKRSTSSPYERSKRRKSAAAKPVHQTRTTRNYQARNTSRKPSPTLGDIDLEQDTGEDDAYQGPKRAKKNKDRPRRSERTKKPVSYGDDTMMLDNQDEEVGDLEFDDAENGQDGDDDEADEVDVDEQ